MQQLERRINNQILGVKGLTSNFNEGQFWTNSQLERTNIKAK